MGIRKALIGVALISSLTGVAQAQTPHTIGAVTIKDLTSNDPAIVPTNPLYFLSQWSWGVKRLFATNKVLFDFEVSDRQAAELKKMYDVVPDKKDLLVRSLSDYRNSLFDVANAMKREKLAGGEDKAAFLKTVTGRLVIHLEFIDELRAKEMGSSEQAIINDAEEHLTDAAISLITGLDTPRDFTSRLWNMFSHSGADVKSLRISEAVQAIIDRIEATSKDADLEASLNSFVDLVHDLFASELDASYRSGPSEVKAVIENLSNLAGSIERRNATLISLASRIQSTELQSAILTAQ